MQLKATVDFNMAEVFTERDKAKVVRLVLLSNQNKRTNKRLVREKDTNICVVSGF